MVKTIFSLLLLLQISHAAESFQTACLSCHQKEGIPTQSLYMRYLQKYSAEEKIKEIIFAYLQNPTIATSIMPKPFINKFGLQPAISLPKDKLKQYIDTMIKNYTIKKRLYLKNQQGISHNKTH